MGDVSEHFLAKIRIFQNDWAPLPKWACCLVRIGAQTVLKRVEPRGPLTLVIVLPTRAFAALLCAAGVVLQRLTSVSSFDSIVQFERLRALSPGTMVTYRAKAGSRFQGVLVRCEEDSIIVKPSTGSTIWINKRFAHAVDPLGPNNAPIPERVTCKAPTESSAFLLELIGFELASSFQGSSRLDCGIVGTEALLRAETKSMRFGVAIPEGKIVEGTIQELLRVRRFAASSTTFHTEVFSSMGDARKGEWSTSPDTAIFDGAKSFLKHGALWPAANRIVLLDRTDRHLDDALAEVNREYLQRDMNGGELDSALLRVPAAETTLYRARLS